LDLFLMSLTSLAYVALSLTILTSSGKCHEYHSLYIGWKQDLDVSKLQYRDSF
jgi:hypothetical protein